MKANSAEPKMPVILARLKRRYKDEMRTFLSHFTPWELLVATMLSAQTPDVQVDKVTPALFSRYRKSADFVKLKPSNLYPYLKTLNFYRTKSRNIIKAAKVIHSEFGGTVPNTIDGLTRLPGVGRKTANIVVANAFGKNEGIAIDTHCITVSNRLFLYKTEDPEKIERRLIKIVPRKDWNNLSHLFIALGRDVCTARRKYCSDCVLKDICPSSDVR